MANKKRRAGRAAAKRAGRAADHDHDQVNLPDLITTEEEEEEQGRVRVDHRDDKNNESGVPFWISAWWGDYQMPHMLVRWAITVCAVALFYKQMKNNSLLLTLALPFHVSSYTKRIYSTLRDGVRSAKNGYNAFKLFLRALPEYDIWYYNTRPFLLGLIMSKAPVEMGLLLLILAASYSLAYLRGRGPGPGPGPGRDVDADMHAGAANQGGCGRGREDGRNVNMDTVGADQRGRGRGHGRGRGGGRDVYVVGVDTNMAGAYQRGNGRGGGRDVDVVDVDMDMVGAYQRGHGRGRGQSYQRGRGRAR